MLKDSTSFQPQTDSADRSCIDLVFLATARACALLATLVTIFIFAFLMKESIPALRSISFLRFATDQNWYPSEKQFGILSMVAGSSLVAMLATAMAAPLGLLIAVFHHFSAPRWMRTISRRMLEMLAGIPSVIYGFWGLIVLVPKINAFQPPGQCLLAGGIIVGLMILPTMTMMVDSALTSVSREIRLSAAALGLSDNATFLHLLMPRLKSGIIAAVTLSMCRALGETMAVIMVTGNTAAIPTSIFSPIRTLTANIALEMSFASGVHRSTLFVSGLVLLAVSALLATGATGLRKLR